MKQIPQTPEYHEHYLGYYYIELVVCGPIEISISELSDDEHLVMVPGSCSTCKVARPISHGNAVAQNFFFRAALPPT